jgi:hypothetical protein
MTSLVLITFLLVAPAPVEQPTVVIVVGAAGASEYGAAFARWAGRWELAAEKGGATCVRVDDRDAAEKSDHERLKAILAAEPKESAEPLWLVLVGHGTFDGEAARFNLRGPDVSATELAAWLGPFGRPVVVVNCASASGPFVNRLSGPDRVVVSATKSGYEQNYARFGDYLSAAISDPAADLDKDDETSLLEAFLLASGRVAEFYEQDGRLATETALLDDNGDGQGTPAAWFRGVRTRRRGRDGAAPDGSRARQVHLIRSPAEQIVPPDVRARRDELERAVARLRDGKNEKTNEDDYYAELEPLFLELARLYATLEAPDDSPDVSP